MSFISPPSVNLKADSLQTFSGGSQAMSIGTTGTGNFTVGNSTSGVLMGNGTALSWSGTTQLNGASSFAAASVNYLTVAGAASGNPVAVMAQGTNSGIALTGTGAGAFTFNVATGTGTTQIGNATGLVGFGQTPDAAQGFVQVLAADDGIGARVKINAAQAGVTASDVFVNFSSTSGIEGSIAGTAAAGVLIYNTFTGGHWSQSDSVKAKRSKKLSTKKKPVWESDLPVGSVLVSTGTMSHWEGEVADHLPKCEPSSRPMDKAVYGVYGGHDRDGDLLVMALGSGIALVNNENGAIEVGDFLCTSSVSGQAMRYDGNDMRVTLGKARQPFDGKKAKAIAVTLLAG